MQKGYIKVQKKKSMVKLFRYESGEIRDIWIILLILIALFAVIIVSRIITILVADVFYMGYGLSPEQALEQAKTLALETGEWQTFSEALVFFGSLVVVFILMKKVDNQQVTWQALGLAWKSESIFMFSGGLLLYSGLFFTALGLGTLRGAIQLTSTSAFSFTVLLVLVWCIFNAFWQELIFRAYLQPRLIQHHGIILGILLATVIFVFIHVLDRPLTLTEFFTGCTIFFLIGLLYYITGSLYLAGGMHTAGNFLLLLLDARGVANPHDLDMFIVFGIALVVVFFLTRDKLRV